MGGHVKSGKGGGQRKDNWHCQGCSYLNFGHRSSCRVCNARPGATAAQGQRSKGAGKGGAADPKPNAWAAGGIAHRQLQQEREAARRRQSELDSLRHEHKKTVERLQKAEAACKAARADDDTPMDDDDADSDDTDARILSLSTELGHAETLLKHLEGSSTLQPDLAQRVTNLKSQIAELNDKKKGPEAKVLGQAGKHAKDLRNARSRFLRKKKAQARLEEELECVDKELAAAQQRREEKQRELDDTKLEAAQAQAEMERLSKAGAAEQDGEDAEPALGPRQRTQRLAEQLAVHFGGHPARAKLDDLIREVIEHNDKLWRAAAAERGSTPSQPTQPHAPAPPPSAPQPTNGPTPPGQTTPQPTAGSTPTAMADGSATSVGQAVGGPADGRQQPKGGGGNAAKASDTDQPNVTKHGNDSEEELIDDAMDVEVEKALALLPPQQGDLLRNAIAPNRGATGSRRSGPSRPEETQRDRERSPRPTKGGNRDA